MLIRQEHDCGAESIIFSVCLSRRSALDGRGTADRDTNQACQITSIRHCSWHPVMRHLPRRWTRRCIPHAPQVKSTAKHLAHLVSQVVDQRGHSSAKIVRDEVFPRWGLPWQGFKLVSNVCLSLRAFLLSRKSRTPTTTHLPYRTHRARAFPGPSAVGTYLPFGTWMNYPYARHVHPGVVPEFSFSIHAMCTNKRPCRIVCYCMPSRFDLLDVRQLTRTTV